MATMITEVYDAFLAGGAPEAKAREAAEALSSESLSTKGDIVKTEGRLARDIVAAEERLNHKIAEVREELSGDIEAARGELSAEIRAVEKRLNHKIDAVKEELSGAISALDKKLTHEIYGIKQGMAVIKTLLLLIIAVQVIPLLKALSVI